MGSLAVLEMGATCENEVGKNLNFAEAFLNEVQSWELLSGGDGSFETEISEIMSNSHAENEQVEIEQVKNDSWACMDNTKGASSKDGQDDEHQLDELQGESMLQASAFSFSALTATDPEVASNISLRQSAAGLTSTATDLQ